jgi:ABC-type multidrug transport system permease subunit
MANAALYELTVTRTKETLRDPEAVFWVFGFPLLLALALGFAFRDKAMDRIPIGVVQSMEAEQLVRALADSPALFPRLYSIREGEEALRAGKISLLINAADGVVYRFDETRPDSRIARLEADEALQRASGRRDPVPVREQHVSEQGARYIDFLVPGLLGLNLMGTGMFGAGFAIVAARADKLLKRLMATPMRKRDYLLSLMLSRLVFLVFEVASLLAFAWLVFGVVVHGSLLLLALVCLVGAAAFSGLGLLVASRVTSMESANGWLTVVMMPMWIVSGVFFSAEQFPGYLQPAIRVLPLTVLNDALRGVITEAQPLTGIAHELTLLMLWGTLSFLVALRIFRWR